MYERIAPEDPTNAPVIINAEFSIIQENKKNEFKPRSHG